MEAGEEKGGWETGFYFLIFTDIVKMGDSKYESIGIYLAKNCEVKLICRNHNFIF